MRPLWMYHQLDVRLPRSADDSFQTINISKWSKTEEAVCTNILVGDYSIQDAAIEEIGQALFTEMKSEGPADPGASRYQTIYEDVRAEMFVSMTVGIRGRGSV